MTENIDRPFEAATSAGRGAAVQAVLRRAGELVANGEAPRRSVVRAIIAAAGEQASDSAVADTLANATICVLAGHWRGHVGNPERPMARLSDWAQDATVDEILTNVNNAATELSWLTDPRTLAQSSPVAQAEHAKRQRDLSGELGALRAGYEQLTSAPWYPAQPGDILHVHFEGVPNALPAGGETYIVEYDQDENGVLVLRLLHVDDDLPGPGGFEGGMPNDPFMEAWMEAGPAALTIVRAGRVVHGAGAGR